MRPIDQVCQADLAVAFDYVETRLTKPCGQLPSLLNPLDNTDLKHRQQTLMCNDDASASFHVYMPSCYVKCYAMLSTNKLKQNRMTHDIET